jgi:phage I-like protein
MNNTTTDPASRGEGDVRFVRTHLAVVPLPMAEDDALAERVLALPWGEVELRDAEIRKFFGEPGSIEVNDRSVEEVPKNFAERDIDYHVNVQHMRGAEAMGWIKDVDVVPGEGLFIDIDWTKAGREKLESRIYRYGSAEVIVGTKSEPPTVTAVTGFALTNAPSVVGMLPVAAETMTAALAGIEGCHNDQPTSRDSGKKGAAQMSEPFYKGLFSRLSGKEPEDEVEAAETASKLRIELDQVAELEEKLEAERQKVEELITDLAAKDEQLEAVEEEKVKAELEALIAEAKKDGKLAPSMEEWARGLADDDREALEEYLDAIDEGTFSPPGQQVDDDAINSPDTTTLAACRY